MKSYYKKERVTYYSGEDEGLAVIGDYCSCELVSALTILEIYRSNTS